LAGNANDGVRSVTDNENVSTTDCHLQPQLRNMARP